MAPDPQPVAPTPSKSLNDDAGVAHLMRAPAALVGMKDPYIASRFSDGIRPTAHAIACIVLGVEQLADWRGDSPGDGPAMVVAAAKVAAELVQHSLQAPFDPAGRTALLESSLAMALPELHDDWVSELIHGSPASRRATISAFFAHYEADEAIVRLTGLLPGGIRQLATNLAAIGEIGALQAVIGAQDGDSIAKSDPLLSGLQALATDDAEAGMEAAWDAATARAAELAELMALNATQSGNHLLALQASERAQRLLPTPLRAAAVAIAHLRLDQIDQALAQTTETPETAEGWIARGLALSAAGMPDAAEAALLAALPKVELLTPIWLLELHRGLDGISDGSAAINVLRAALAQTPADPEIRGQLVSDLIAAGEFSEAARHTQVLLAMQPNELRWHRLAASAHEAAGEHQSAMGHWLSVAETEPAAKHAIVRTAIAADDLTTALSFAQDLIQASPKDADARIALGRTLIASGNARGGLIHLRKATDLEPNSSRTWKALAEAQMAEDELDEARASLAAGAAACPGAADIQMLMAELASREARWTEAVAACERVLAIEPNNTQARWLMAEAQHASGDRESAIDNYRGVLRSWPGRVDVKLALVALLEARELLAEAASIARSVELTTDLERADHYLLGRILASVENETNDAGAMAHLVAAKEAGVDEPALDYWLGRAHLQLGQGTEAISAFQLCLKSVSDGDDALKQACTYHLALAAFQAEQTPVTISVLERARTESALDARALGLLATAYLSAGLPKDAVDPALQACELAPNDPQWLDVAVDAAMSAGEPERVLDRVHSWAMSSEDPDHGFVLARLYARMNRPADLRRALATALHSSRHDAAKQRLAAELLTSVGEHHAALRWFERAFQAKPDDPGLKQAVAQSASAAEAHGLAEQLWSELLEEAPTLDHVLGAADALWHQGKRAAAIGQLQRALTMSQDDATLKVRLARAHLANGEVAKGLAQYQDAATDAPDNRAIIEEAAHAMLELGEAQRALSLIGEPSSAADSVGWLMLRAKAALAAGQPQVCLSSIGRIPVEARPGEAAAMATIALGESGDWEAAESRLDELIQSGELTGSTWGARAALRFGQWQAAMALVTDEQSLSTSWLDRYITFARVLDAATLLHHYAGTHEVHPGGGWVSQAHYSQLMSQAPKSLASTEFAALERRMALARGEGADLATQADSDLPRHRRLREHALEGLALAHLTRGEPEAALETLSRSGHDAHAGRWGALLAGIAHHLAGRGEMARKAWGSISGAPWMQAAAVYLTARSHQDDGEIAAATQALNQAVLLRPGIAAWQHLLGQLYVKMDAFEKAVAHLQQAAEIEPDDAGFQRDLAQALTKAGQLSEAHSAYAKSMKSLAANPDVLAEFAGVSMAIGDPRAALSRFRQALELRPDDVQALIGAAEASLMTGDHITADRYATQALRLAPNDAPVVGKLAGVLLGAGRARQALAALDSIQAGPEADPAFLQTRARVLVQMGRAPEAIDLLLPLVDTDGANAEAWALLADAYQAVGRAEDALDSVRMALEHDPKHPDYRLRMAQLFRFAGQLDHALAELSLLAEESPADSRVAYETGMVHKARRELSQALTSFERAIELDFRCAPAHYEAGLALKSLKSYSQAAQAFQAVVDLDPQNSDALHQLAAVQALALVHDNIQSPAVST